MEAEVNRLIDMAKDLASRHNDAGMEKAAEIMLYLINAGHENPEILVSAASYLLQGPSGNKRKIKDQAVALIDKALSFAPENISILERAILSYELVLNDFPDKLNDIIRLCLKILDLDPDHVNCMVTLAYHRHHPGVALKSIDAIQMLEWAKEVEPNNILVDSALARLYMESGNYRRARSLYQKIIANTDSDSMESLDAQRQIKSVRPESRFKRRRKYGVN